MKFPTKAFILLLPFSLTGGILAATYPAYHREKTACESQGRFYWRGQCFPNECRFEIHP